MDKVTIQTEVQYYSDLTDVNVADRWRERLCSYLGRSHGRVEGISKAWLK